MSLAWHGAVPEHRLPQVDDAFRFGGAGCPLQGARPCQAGDGVLGVGIVVAAVGETHVLVGGADADALLLVGGGGHRVAPLVCFGILQAKGAGVNLPRRGHSPIASASRL